MRPHHLPLLALLAGCTPMRPAETVPPVPLQQGSGITDPGRQAVLSAAYVFGNTGSIAGRPAEAARAAARLEWMAAAMPQDQRWAGAVGTLFPALGQARDEVRGSLGVAPAASADAVVRAELAAADALDAGRRAEAARALDPVASGQGAAAVARMERLPPQPRAAYATRLAQNEMVRLTQDDPE